ncbi:unnamed protein product [Symbiodinium microadriaticum]|nr:unnamed protein product [Symbiodinium microadriaticum]CAE7658541.1 unnamed protein product [Symbiodinium sp. KB8]
MHRLEMLLKSLDAAPAPPALLAPRRQALEEVAEELRAAHSAAAVPKKDEEAELALCDREAEVRQLLDRMMEEIAREPWHSPPAQRRLLGLERGLREAAEELARSARNMNGPEKNLKFIRPVNMKDPEDVRVSGMAADPPSRMEPDRLGDHHGISAIILGASGDKTGKNLSDVFGPKAHCAAAIQRILHTMS